MIEDIRNRWQAVQKMRAAGYETEVYETELEALADDLGTLLHRVAELHQVIAGNVEHSIAAWLEKVADAHEARQRNAESPGWSAEDVRAHHYRDAARGIRAGEWRK